MWNTEEESQALPHEQVNHLRRTLVGSTSVVETFDSRAGTVEHNENMPIKWWALTLPILALMLIAAVRFIDPAATTGAEQSRLWPDFQELPEMQIPKIQATKSPEKPQKKVFVSSIAYNEKRALAFINDQMVSEGDVVDGFTVIKIHPEAVEFESNGEKWTQKLGD